MAQNDSEWPVLPDSHLFQSFPIEVAQNDSEPPISPNLQLFQSFPTEAAQNDSEGLISPDSQLLQSFPIKPAQNDLEWPPKSPKSEMLIFGLCSTFDDWPSNLSNEIQSKCEKMKNLDIKTDKVWMYK